MKVFLQSFLLLALILSMGPKTAGAVQSYQQVRDAFQSSDTVLLDRHGFILYEIRTDPNVRRLGWTSLADISPALQQAVITAEDRHFYTHHGVDYPALIGSAFRSIHTRKLRGASTIPMQIASLLDKNLQVRQGRRSFNQKWLQIRAAQKLDASWSKQQMLEAYLNLIYFSGEFQGIASASRGLFGKDPHGLNRAESLVLAALIRAPHAESDSLVFRAEQLNRSMDWQIPESEITDRVRQAIKGPRVIAQHANLAPHAARRLLKDTGKTAAMTTTLDSDLQRFSAERLRHQLLQLKSQHVGEGAVLVVENQTGHILAYVSDTTDPARNRFVDGILAKRQAGSSLKPFLYSAAFDSRILTPASLLDDSPLDLPQASGIYQPGNYDGEHKGPVSARYALASSLNIPAVRVIEMVGMDPFLQVLKNFGIEKLHESGSFYGPSLALGTADVTLWELVNAYRSIACGGIFSPMHLSPAGQPQMPPQRIISQEAAFLVSDILSDRTARSLTFGLENVLATRFWSAVKTGTSKDMRDNWCIGYSDKYTTGVWVGNFTGSPMWDVSGITGAAPLWFEIMNRLHQDGDDYVPHPPEGVVRYEPKAGKISAETAPEWFIRGTEPVTAYQTDAASSPRIIYPPSGAIFAVDPDIPEKYQRIFFTLNGRRDGLHWTLDEKPIGDAGRPTAWTPVPGRHLLALCDSHGTVMDTAGFVVRGRYDSIKAASDETLPIP